MALYRRGILIGLVAAAIVTLPNLIWTRYSDFAWNSPFSLLIALVVVAFFPLVWRIRGTLRYGGVSDLMFHIHRPPSGDSPLLWAFHGAISFVLCIFGGVVGPEGAAVELTQSGMVGTRPHSARWFDHFRRTDVACALAGSVSASFGSPLGAILIPVEYRTGGQTLAPVLSAISGYLGMEFFGWLLKLERFTLAPIFSQFGYGDLLDWRVGVLVVFLGVFGGLAGGFLTQLVRLGRESFYRIFDEKVAMRIVVVALGLTAIFYYYPTSHSPGFSLVENVLLSRVSTFEVGFLAVSQILVFLLVMIGLGTVGVFWPVFCIGTLLGYVIGLYHPDCLALSALLGGAALWGSALGLPIAGALVAFSLAGNLAILAPALIVAILASWISELIRSRSLSDQDMIARGLNLDKGRSTSILNSLTVGGAMVSDHESARENNTIDELYTFLHRSHYPFLPIVNSKGKYLGLLTADVVESEWRKQETSQDSRFSKILEAKDLLYHSTAKIRPVRVDDRLSVTTGLFEETPVVPVLGEEERVVGLLFAHSVRIAYDQEVARRSLFFRQEEVVSNT